MTKRRIAKFTSFLFGCAAVAALMQSRAAHADLRDTVAFDIASQQLPSALNRFSAQAGVQVTSRGELIEGKISRAVSGKLSAREALNLLLRDTDLRYDVIDDKTVVIVPTDAAAVGDGSRESAGEHARLALVPQSAGADGAGSSTAQKSDARENSQPDAKNTQEVVVTAQKREERARDVPVPLTVIDASSLLSSNKLRMTDYYTQIPGLSLTPSNFANPQVTIRGLTSGPGTNPTVGIVVDDVPYGSATTLGGGAFSVPDFDPSELERIEVLRGPQGTLYGANSLGGLVKYVTRDPSMDGVSGRVETGASSVHNGDELGYNVRAAVNVPLGEAFAIRASAFTRRDPGYIDNVQTGEDAVNWTQAEGGRLSALWQPSENFSLKLNALLQHIESHGFPYFHRLPGLGDLEQSTLRGTGLFELDSQAYSAVFKAKMGRADFTAISGYSVNKGSELYDFTYVSGARAQAAFGVGGVSANPHTRGTKFTQEIRMSMPLGSRIEWLLGGFYTDDDARFLVEQWAIDPATGVVAGRYFYNLFPTSYKEHAAFTNFTFQLSERLDVQVGGRGSKIKQSYSTIWSGPFVTAVLNVPDPLVPPPASTRDDTFTYLVTPRFKMSPDLMVYARLASGYRPGGPNSNSTINQLATYAPDKTQNYEVGLKGDAFGRKLTFDASVYYIDWRDIQITVTDPVTRVAIFTNASRAKSQGVELSLQVHPLAGMTISTWGAWNDADLTEGFPAGSVVRGAEGDRLPVSSRLSGNLSVDQEFALTDRLDAFVGGSVTYVGERLGFFTGNGVRRIFPAYSQVDARAGVTFETWSANLFLNNATDKRGLLTGASSNQTAWYPIQPRTVGISIAKSF